MKGMMIEDSAVEVPEDVEVVSMSLQDAQGYDWHLVPLPELRRISDMMADIDYGDSQRVKAVIDSCIRSIEGGAKSL